MICKICSSEKIKIIYEGRIRNGGLGHYTEQNVPVYQCQKCGVIWHDNVLSSSKDYYESAAYRNALDGGTEEERFYLLYDKETLDKFLYTGTTVFRNKIVADIGCGCGAFLDFINGVARQVIGIEPSEIYCEIMRGKGFHTYSYTEKAILDYKEQVDVVTSFDVIEHVEEPEKFLKEIYELLSAGGRAIIGTPTDAPIMRSLLGEIYEKQLLFSVQHLWIFSEKCMRMMAEECGYKGIKIKYFQRYGMVNLLGWVRDKIPKTEIAPEIISNTMDSVWKSQCCDNKLGDYLVIYLEK